MNANDQDPYAAAEKARAAAASAPASGSADTVGSAQGADYPQTELREDGYEHGDEGSGKDDEYGGQSGAAKPWISVNAGDGEDEGGDKDGPWLHLLSSLPVLAYLFLGFTFGWWWQALPIFSLMPIPHAARALYRRFRDN